MEKDDLPVGKIAVVIPWFQPQGATEDQIFLAIRGSPSYERMYKANRVEGVELSPRWWCFVEVVVARQIGAPISRCMPHKTPAHNGAK